MKKIWFSFILAFVCLHITKAQTPEAFKYQAVSRDGNNQPIANTEIDVRFSILKSFTDIANASVVYVEEHIVTTSELGLFNAEVGNGLPMFGDFSKIDWSEGNYFLKVFISTDQGKNFMTMGASQLLSVPYAMHAKTADIAVEKDGDPQNEIQHLEVDTVGPSALRLKLSRSDSSVLIPIGSGIDTDNQVILKNTVASIVDPAGWARLQNTKVPAPPVLVDANPDNELQYLDIDKRGETSILKLLDFKGNVFSTVTINDTDPNNEMQNIKVTKNGEDSDISLLDQNGNIVDSDVITDTDPKNELQKVKITQNGDNSDIELLDHKNKVVSSDIITDTDPKNELQSVQVTRNGDNSDIKLLDKNNKVVSMDKITDTDPTNELQTLKVAEGKIILKDGNGKITNSIPVQDIEVVDVSPNGGTVFIKLTNGKTIQAVDESSENELQELDVELVQGQNGAETDLIIRHKGNSQTAWQKAQNDTVRILDTDPFNELQELEFNSVTGELKISGGNGIIIPSSGGGEDGDMDPFNEIQTLSKNGSTIMLSYEGGQVVLEDDDPTNELQRLEFNPQSRILKISDGNNVYIPGGAGGEDGDNDPKNELQDLEFDPYEKFLYISGGRGVALDGLSPWNRSGSAVFFKGAVEGELFRTDHSHYGDGYMAIRNNQHADVIEMGNDYSFGPFLYLYDNNGDLRAGFRQSGNKFQVFADQKNFRMDHPEDPDKEIWYTSLEGPEAAAYERGTAQLADGEVFVPFSEHFRLVANAKTMTVHLTPLSADTYGLAVVEKTEKGFKVKELRQGKGNFKFDWEVKCVRKGHEDFKPVRDKSEQ